MHDIHNFDLNSSDRRKLFGKIEMAKRKALCDPVNHLVVILGDFNFHTAGEASTKFGTVGPTANVSIAKHGDTENRRWRVPLYGMTEIFQSDATRIGDRKENEDRQITAARIDRVYVSTPPWILMHLRAGAKVTVP